MSTAPSHGRPKGGLLRTALWLAVPLNLFGAGMFGFAAVGHAPGLIPVEIPPLYAAQLAWIIGLFAGVYGYLAGSRELNCPLLAVGALGKIGFFLLFALYSANGAVPTKAVLQASPDLILGTIFLIGAIAQGRQGRI